MSTLNLSRDIIFPSVAASAVRQTTRLETVTMACTVGMAGAGLVILVVVVAQMAVLSIYSALMDPAGTPTIGMRLAPLVWGLAILVMHITCLRRISDAFWRSAAGIGLFACLALSVSLLFTTLLLTITGLGVLAVMLAMMMVTGFSITAIGLVVWVMMRMATAKGSALTGL